jgi:hypothetical protein
MKKAHAISIAFLAVICIGIIIATFIFFREVIGSKLFLKAGKPMQFGSYTVLIDRIEGNKLYGIKVSSKNRIFKAESGDYVYLPKKNALKFNLIDGFANDYDPANPRQYHTLTFKQSYITIQLK